MSDSATEHVPKAGWDKFTAPAILTMIGAICVHICIGCQYAWGNISVYIVSYFRNVQGDNVTMSQFYAVLPIIVLGSTFVFPIGMFLSGKIGPKAVVAIGGFFAIGSTFLSSFVTSPTVWFFLYSIGFGVGKGCLYPAPLFAGWSHLPGRKGFVSGFIVAGLGVGAFVYGVVTTLLVNPTNEPAVPTLVSTSAGESTESFFAAETADNVPRMLRTLCVIWLCQIGFGICTITMFKKEDADVKDGEQALLEDKELTPDEIAEKNATVGAMVASGTFWHIYAISLTQIFYGYYIINQFKTYGLTYGHDDTFLSITGAIGALFNGLLRIFWSGLLDKYPFHNVYGTLCGIQIFLICTIAWMVPYKWLYFWNICLSMMCEGAICSILPTITLMKFGHHRGHDVFAFMFSSYGVSSMGGAVLVNLLQYQIGFNGFFILSLVLTLITVGLMIQFRADEKFDYKTIASTEVKTEIN